MSRRHLRNRKNQTPPNPTEAPGRERTERAVRKWATVVLCAALLGLVVFASVVALDRETPSAAPSQPASGSAELLVRENSRKLNDPPEAKATFVEFLDFECEACGAAYPSIEKLRQTYADRVTFVVRYFPIQSHVNAMRAARAVEAAAQQGQLEGMYAKMYQNQKDWAEKQVPQDEVFRQYAQQLGLDMAKWDTAYSDPATSARIQADMNDGAELGVEGTPTFFLDGKKIEPKSFDELTSLIEAAISGK